ncbi:hypothetical protein OEZ85_009617 [Tetradesmus obliquus]|uniref:CCHC-type domain-containing protein n=1 Tax=Tetradesmus obliquus TaxID=3088 RepID=A0ABY8UCE1_TETOB|nr:hypothetical protein OEZ85_009617 [Tetradesmus obliquus]
MDALAAAAAGLNLEGPLTPAEESEVDFLGRLLEAAGQAMPRPMLVQSFRSNKDLLRDYALSACAKPISNIGPQGSSKSSLFKDLSKQHTCGILYTGSRAKDNPLDIRSYLSSCGLWLSLKPVPENLQFCYGYFNFLHSDARAEVFSQLKGCNPADLTDGSYTWDDFCQGVLGSALAGRKETDMQILYDCSGKRSDRKQPQTLQIVGELEVLWSRMQQQPDDVTKIWLVHRAVHPKLRDSIAYTADSMPWATYTAFRASLVNHAGPFDQMVARESGRTPADAIGEGNARHRRFQRRNFTPRQHFQPKGGVNKPGNGFGKGKFKPKPPGPPTCYGCGEKGHIRRDCPKEQKK